MMEKFKILITMLLFSGIIFTSCGDDDPVQPTQDKNFMPLQQGNNWKYETNNIDTSNNKIEPSFMDSSAVTGTENKSGQNAFVVTNFRLGNDGWFQRSKQHYYKSNNIVYSHSDFFSSIQYEGQELDLGISGQWLAFVRQDQNQWNILESIPTDTIALAIPNVGDVNLFGTLDVTANNQGTETVIANNLQYDATKILYTAVMKANIVGLPGIPVTLTTSNTYWYVDGVGIVKKRLNPGSVSSSVYNFKLPGEESILLKANVLAVTQ